MKTIILDFDGTIADTFKLSIEIAHKLTGHESLINSIEVNKLKRDSIVEVVKKLEIPKYQLPLLIFRGRRQMTKRLSEVKPFTGMDDVLRDLHKKGYRVFILSTNSNKNISGFLKSHGLNGYVRRIYGSVGLLSKSRALRKVMKQNKLNPEDVIYVGDEVRDIEAAKSLNVAAIAVSWGFNDVDRLGQELPMALVQSRPDLFKALEAWEAS
jgi:phosphoglycolate phosphatase-like HAD superfamily hydrolase